MSRRLMSLPSEKRNPAGIKRPKFALAPAGTVWVKYAPVGGVAVNLNTPTSDWVWLIVAVPPVLMLMALVPTLPLLPPEGATTVLASAILFCR